MAHTHPPSMTRVGPALTSPSSAHSFTVFPGPTTKVLQSPSQGTTGGWELRTEEAAFPKGQPTNPRIRTSVSRSVTAARVAMAAFQFFKKSIAKVIL